ncbi:MAG: sugar-binding protein, partial [Armatimonadota bacterium]
MKQRKHLVAALWAIALLAATLPALGRARTDRVRIFTTWDSTFFYAAFDVNDPDIQGASRAPNAPVAEGDDAVAVYFHTDRTDSSGLDEHSFRMVVSAAGGAEFARGENGAWKLVPITTFKYSVQRSGSLNDNQDDDVGYSVEMAIPWKELGIEADVGTALRFNAAIWLAGEHRGFVSLSPEAARAGNLNDPSLWLELWLRGPVQPLLARSEGRVLANRVAIRPPVVDGRISPGEYPEKGMLEVEKPPLAQAVRVFRDIPVESLVFAEYEPDPLGTRPASSLVSKPFGGTGPWTSGLSVAWHRQQMRDALRA